MKGIEAHGMVNGIKNKLNSKFFTCIAFDSSFRKTDLNILNIASINLYLRILSMARRKFRKIFLRKSFKPKLDTLRFD